MTFLEVYFVTFGTILLMMAGAWLIATLIHDVSIVDIIWGLGFVLATLCHLWLAPEGWLPRKLFVTGLYGVWGIRLAAYLAWRKAVQSPGEDYRYARIRAQIGPSFRWKSLFLVFGLQGLLIGVLSVVSLAAHYSPQPAHFTLFDGIGLVLWVIGFGFEAVGDMQLAQFKANPANKGKVMRSGLWSLTRHPNYFGDAVMWWGYFMVAVSVPFGFLTVYAPLIMNFLLLRISGVALLERDLTNKRPDYAAYIREVPAFVPRLRRR